MPAKMTVSYSDTKKAAPVQEHQSGRVEKGLPTIFSASILQKYREDCQA